MGIGELVRDRHVGQHHGHTFEIAEDGVAKRVTLSIDGAEVAGESCILPQRIELTGKLDGADVRAIVVVRLLQHSEVSLQVGGVDVPLQKSK